MSDLTRTIDLTGVDYAFTPHDRGHFGRIACWTVPVDGLDGLSRDIRDLRTRFADFVERTNSDKHPGAGRLAELICEEFNLPEVA